MALATKNKISRFSSHALSLPMDNIDTDQIIPARFLRITDKDGLAEALFSDWRKSPDFILNQDNAKGAKVLVVGDNFGCGSSREHAPWALVAFGFRAVVSTSFADIFKNNALKNGLLPIIVSAEILAELHRRVVAEPGFELTIDLASQQVSFVSEGDQGGDVSATFPIEPFSKKCLLEGLDELGYILSHDAAIAAFETGQKANR
jgi:3-isopropylmalate/(R)-2-methylmalate dehydratase small subunit